MTTQHDDTTIERRKLDPPPQNPPPNTTTSPIPNNTTTPKLRKPRFNQQQVLALTAGATVASIILQLLLWPVDSLCGVFRFLSVIATAAYTPSYFDGSESTPLGRVWTLALRDKWQTWWRNTYFNKSPPLIFDGEKPDPNKQYIVALSPHGVLSLCHWSLNTCSGGLTDAFGPKRRSLGGSVIFNIPLYRDLMLAGGLVDASPANTKALLGAGYTVALLPGGLQEQVETEQNVQAIYIKKRMGIFKYALDYDVPVVPIFSMREVALVQTWNPLTKFRMWVCNTFGIPIYFWNPFTVGENIPCIAGNAVYLKRSGDVTTSEEVEKLHGMYIEEVKRIYNKYKAEYGFADQELVIR